MSLSAKRISPPRKRPPRSSTYEGEAQIDSQGPLRHFDCGVQLGLRQCNALRASFQYSLRARSIVAAIMHITLIVALGMVVVQQP